MTRPLSPSERSLLTRYGYDDSERRWEEYIEDCEIDPQNMRRAIDEIDDPDLDQAVWTMAQGSTLAARETARAYVNARVRERYELWFRRLCERDIGE